MKTDNLRRSRKSVKEGSGAGGLAEVSCGFPEQRHDLAELPQRCRAIAGCARVGGLAAQACERVPVDGPGLGDRLLLSATGQLFQAVDQSVVNGAFGRAIGVFLGGRHRPRAAPRLDEPGQARSPALPPARYTVALVARLLVLSFGRVRVDPGPNPDD